MLLLPLLAGCLEPSSTNDALGYLARELPGQDANAHAAIALAVAHSGVDLDSWPPSEPILEWVTMPDSFGGQIRLLTALALARADAPGVSRAGLIDAVWAAHDGQQFGAEASLADDMLAVEALRAAGVEDARIQAAAQRIAAAQSADGGWRYNGGAPGEVDETSWALAALAAADALQPHMGEAAVDFMVAGRGEDGAYGYGGNTNCQSSGMALRAWALLGMEPPSSTRAYVAACQNPDGGYPFMRGGPSQLRATTDILIGLAAA